MRAFVCDICGSVNISAPNLVSFEDKYSYSAPMYDVCDSCFASVVNLFIVQTKDENVIKTLKQMIQAK